MNQRKLEPGSRERPESSSSSRHVSRNEFRGPVDAQTLDCDIYPMVWPQRRNTTKKEVKQSTVPLNEISVRQLTGILIILRTMSRAEPLSVETRN